MNCLHVYPQVSFTPYFQFTDSTFELLMKMHWLVMYSKTSFFWELFLTYTALKFDSFMYPLLMSGQVSLPLVNFVAAVAWKGDSSMDWLHVLDDTHLLSCSVILKCIRKLCMGMMGSTSSAASVITQQLKRWVSSSTCSQSMEESPCLAKAATKSTSGKLTWVDAYRECIQE